MAFAKFKSGEGVSISRSHAFLKSGAYRIVDALPADGGPLRYRVRNDAEVFDRVVEEDWMEPAPV